jgi:hypothetical protein
MAGAKENLALDKKKPACLAGFKLFSWRRIVETGSLCCSAEYMSNFVLR